MPQTPTEGLRCCPHAIWRRSVMKSSAVLNMYALRRSACLVGFPSIKRLGKSTVLSRYPETIFRRFVEGHARLKLYSDCLRSMPGASSDRVTSVKVVLLGEGPLDRQDRARRSCRPVPRRPVCSRWRHMRSFNTALGRSASPSGAAPQGGSAKPACCCAGRTTASTRRSLRLCRRPSSRRR